MLRAPFLTIEATIPEGLHLRSLSVLSVPSYSTKLLVAEPEGSSWSERNMQDGQLERGFCST